MKTVIALSALALVTNLAIAGDFAYERQFSSEDLASETSGLEYRSSNPAPSMQSGRISLHEIYRGNPDTETLREGFENSTSVDMNALPRTSYDVIVKDNPDLEA